jgi:hypothetical protein
MLPKKSYQPTETELAWARCVSEPLADGGILVYPSSGLMYRLDRAARTWTLLNPRPAFEGLHHWTRAVFGSLGYRVLPEQCVASNG